MFFFACHVIILSSFFILTFSTCQVVKEQINFLGIRDALWEKSDNERCFHVIFPVDLEDSDFVIQHLKNFGVGIHLDSSIGFDSKLFGLLRT